MSSKNNISERALRDVGLLYTDSDAKGITRRRRGRGFSYIDARGAVIKSARVRQRLASIAVPPSYENVWYCPEPQGHLQATGYDANGKKQYFYHQDWEGLRDKTKFLLMARFGKGLPAIRRRIARQLKRGSSNKETVLCGIVRILDSTGMRIGSLDAEQTNHTYGLTTLRKRHIKLTDGAIHFSYKGKGGTTVVCELADQALTDVIEACEDIPGGRLFDYLDDDDRKHPVYAADVNEFIRARMGDSFSAKDFRTWRFSCLFLEELLGRTDDPDRTLTGALDAVVRRTCNTPAVLKNSYIHPGLLRLFHEGGKRRLAGEPAAVAGLRKSERILLKYVASKHARSCLAG